MLDLRGVREMIRLSQKSKKSDEKNMFRCSSVSLVEIANERDDQWAFLNAFLK